MQLGVGVGHPRVMLLPPTGGSLRCREGGETGVGVSVGECDLTSTTGLWCTVAQTPDTQVHRGSLHLMAPFF